MLGLSLIFVGITLIINGIFFYAEGKSKKYNHSLIILNFFTAFLVLFLNFYSIVTTKNSKDLIGYFGGLLFGLTNFLIAFDIIFDTDYHLTGIYSGLATICAWVLSIYYLVELRYLQTGAWFLWGIIWLFLFIASIITKKFQKANCFMLILQGITTTFIFGFLLLFNIIKF